MDIHFEKEENRTITPLRKSNKRGTSGSKWKQAYQALKHNRSKNYTEGNMKNCIDALATLYILNIYYKDESFKLSSSEVNGFDQTMGSNFFSFLINKGKSFDGHIEEDASAIYCINFTQEFIDKWERKQIDLNKYIYERVYNDKRIVDAINSGQLTIEEIGNIEKIQNIIGIDAFTDYLRNAMSKININQILAEREYHAYTNKIGIV